MGCDCGLNVAWRQGRQPWEGWLTVIPSSSPRFNEQHANDLRPHGKENLQTEGGGEREGEIFLGYFRSRAHIRHLRLGFKKLKQRVRSVAWGLILMRQEAVRGRESMWVTRRKGDRFFSFTFGGERVSIKSLLYHTLKAIGSFHLASIWKHCGGRGGGGEEKLFSFSPKEGDISAAMLSKSNPRREDTSYHQRASQSTLSAPPPPSLFLFCCLISFPTIHMCHSSANFSYLYLYIFFLLWHIFLPFLSLWTSSLWYWTELRFPPPLVQFHPSHQETLIVLAAKDQ